MNNDYENSIMWVSLRDEVKVLYVKRVSAHTYDDDNPCYVCEELNKSITCIREHNMLKPLKNRDDFDRMKAEQRDARIRKLYAQAKRLESQ